MKKLIMTILIAIIILPSLAGCWDSREVTELAIAVALGIDKNDDGVYSVSAQILNTRENASTIGGSGGGYATPVTTYTVTGEILFEALRKILKQMPREIYLAHIKMIVIGESVAKEGIYDALDFLSRDHEMRTDYYIVVAKDETAENILKVLTNLEKIPSKKLFNSLESLASEYAFSEKINLNDLIDDIVSEGVQPVLPGVTIIGNPKSGLTTKNVETISPKAMISYTGMAAFRKNKLVGWLNEDESKGLNYVKNNVDNTVIVIDMYDGKVGIEITESKTNVVPKFINGEPSLDINITGEANVADVNTKIDLMSPSVFSELTEITNERIKEVVLMAINKGQEEFEADIFGFGEQIHKTKPREWTKLKDNWSEIFPEVTVNINPDIKIRGIGTITNPFHNELMEE